MPDSRPIGVFDSGVGGLSILSAIGFAVLLLIPFGFGDWNYVLAQYRAYAGQLATITNAVPGQWYAQTEISTLLRALGLELGSNARLAIRVLVAIGTLVLAWRIAALGDREEAFER